MSSPASVIVIRDPVEGPGIRRTSALVDQIIESWPGETRPKLRDLTLAEAGAATFSGSSVDGVLLLTAEGTPTKHLLELAERLQDASLGALVVGEKPGRMSRLAPPEAWLVRSMETAPEELASSLHALCARQPAVRRLGAELAIAQRGSAGMTTEFDKLGEEMRLASRLQRELVPSDTSAADWLEAAAMFRPATFVSGDIYDLRPLDEDRVAFFVADAVGHGVPAALLTMIISRTLRLDGRAGESPVGLDLAARRLNNELVRLSGTSGRFATAVVGIIDRASQSLSIVNAGHPAPMLWTDGRLEQIDATGPLLGVFPEAEFEVESYAFPPGAQLVLYSDGFETAFGELGEHGRKRPTRRHLDALEHVVSSRGSMVDAIGRLEHDVDVTAGSLAQDDDLTALAIRRAA